jgi:regulator of protease activity HflC (stomatin/prohibitin superfamily)
MKKFALLLLAALAFAGCSKVPVGNVGVKAYLLGTSKGVTEEVLKPGRYYIGVNEELYLFPTYTQNYTWTWEWVDDNRDGMAQSGEGVDESIPFQSVEGLVVSGDIGISYSIEPDKVPLLFQKFRKGVDEITDTYLRNTVRDALVAAGGTRPIEDIYGAGKEALMVDVTKRVRDNVAPLGINVERLYWAGTPRLPATVIGAINAKVQATQFAAQRANEVAAAKAEADKEIEKARGIAQSKLLTAKADADAIEMQGEAIRRNPQVMELRAIDKWGGGVPQVIGSAATPFITLPGK